MLFDSVFYDENDPSWIRRMIRFILIWYLIDTALFMFIGIASADFQAFISGLILLFWLIFTRAVFKSFYGSSFVKNRFFWIYVPFVFLLSIIEEVLIYFNGGGLGGEAESLTHDLILAIPVFVCIGIGVFVINRRIPLRTGEFFLLGAIQGFLIEIIFAGNILFVWLFGGAVLGIYGSIMGSIVPTYETAIERSKKKSALIMIIGSIFCFFMVIVGAVVGDTLCNLII